ncbi:UNVERIFIED_CONTAM: hypothetical protein K2H54_021534 [Gekko kuhli]
MQCIGSDSQPTLSQPPSTSVSPGNTVKLSCAMSSGSSFVNHVDWYQQKPGNPPRWLLSYFSDSNKYQGSGVPSRFSGSKDASGSTGYLTIAGALVEDEAVYYCGTWPSSAYHSDTIGWGTETKTSPSVSQRDQNWPRG